MHKGSLGLLIRGGTENWSVERWKAHFEDKCQDRPVVVLPDRGISPDDIHYVAVWKPAPGRLTQFPNLRAIFNLGAGVDALMADPTIPSVPVVRVTMADLAGRMTEYVTLHVLLHHRQELHLRQAQRDIRWQPRLQWPARRVTVGIMGYGTLGRESARVLRALGFRVVAWGRTVRDHQDVTYFNGDDQLDAFLAETNILVCLLPLTPATAGILNQILFQKLNRESPLGAPVLINAGRGGLQNEPDIARSLDDGTLGAASLDVFCVEPLPAESPLWTHPKVVITPHNAADVDPDTTSQFVADLIASFEATGRIENIVDRSRGY
jgi:glyoxylate/hydroxypyruvate reductase